MKRVSIWVQEGIALEQVIDTSAVRGADFIFFKNLSQIISQGANSRNLILFRASLVLNAQDINAIPNFEAAALISTGTDNVDTTALSRAGVKFFHYAGMNARAVRDYVVEALLLFIEQKKILPTVAVIGKGNVGSLVVAYLQRAGFSFLWYDPRLDEKKISSTDSLHRAKTLQQLSKCEIFTFHVPLHEDFPHATLNMLDENYFHAHSEQPYIIQTSRGKLWQQDFYYRLLNEKKIWAQDVYPQEPPPSAWLEAFFSTPHVSGYSMLGRLQALQLAIKDFFLLLQIESNENFFLPLPSCMPWSLAEESLALKKNPSSFLERRDNFFWRKEFFQYDNKQRENFFSRFAFLQKNFPKVLHEVFTC